MVSPDDIHTSNIIQTEQVVLRNMHAHTYMNVATI